MDAPVREAPFSAAHLTSARNKQHLAFMVALGELYPEADVVRAVLSSTPTGERKRILDLGTSICQLICSANV